jgi:hypothetical protein
VTGPPATGKTTLAERISRELGLPLVAKDAIKERLYDTVGAGDRAWSQRLGRVCTAPRETVIERYAFRSRHGGHLDDVVLEELRGGLHADQWRPLTIPGEALELDGVTGDADAVVERVRALVLAGSDEAPSAFE